METPDILPVLDAEEIRVLGCLIEKSKTTPEYYPMTINGLTAACNQKTSRNPVMHFSEEDVVQTLDRLKRKNLVATATGGSSRVTKYKHNLALMFPFTPDELAVLCLLFLRGAQTPGEINTNSGRLYEFDDLSEVHRVLEKLASGDMPFIKQIPRKAGQKEMRFVHLFRPFDESEHDQESASELPASSQNTEMALRLSALELEVAELKNRMQQLLNDLGVS